MALRSLVSSRVGLGIDSLFCRNCIQERSGAPVLSILILSLMRLSGKSLCLYIVFFFFGLVGLVLSGCASGNKGDSLPPVPTGTRVIEFAGYNWYVRSTGGATQGPGPNLFSDGEENVWVDDQGRLHLKIRQVNGKWYCSEVTLQKVYGPAKYTVVFEEPVAGLDKNAVAAAFLYKSDREELDIEFSKWGLEENDIAQFVVQPSETAGNKLRFDWGEHTSAVGVIDWQPERVDFSLSDEAGADQEVSWSYTGENIPSDPDTRFKLNLWLFRGMAPSNMMEQELVIGGFKVE